MSRSERYIAPSEEELQRMRKAREAAEQFDRERMKLLKRALNRVRKKDLIELTLCIAEADEASGWILEKKLEVEKPIGLLVNDIEIAIDIATRIDERRLNHNFNYDWRAYDAIYCGLSQIIRKGAIEEAKSLAIKLMDKGSCQVECTDEGLMQEEIENCLRPVIATVVESPGGSDWALEMIRHDRIGVLCEQELSELVGRSHNAG